MVRISKELVSFNRKKMNRVEFHILKKTKKRFKKKDFVRNYRVIK